MQVVWNAFFLSYLFHRLKLNSIKFILVHHGYFCIVVSVIATTSLETVVTVVAGVRDT